MTSDAIQIQGIVLAGVHAWGESALEQVCPRPLLPVVGRPLVWYVLDWLRQAGVRRASICANSDTSVFQQCLGSGTLNDMRLDYYADLMPRGPAGCVHDAAGKDTDSLVVVEASVAAHVDLAALLEAHQRSRAALTAVVMGSDEPAGVYVLSRRALRQIPARGYQDIKEVLIPRLYERGETVMTYPVDGRRNLRVRDAASYLAANSWALEGPSPAWVPRRSYKRAGQTWIHESARVADTARLIGPVVIGPGCRIEEGATIVGTTTLGAHCRIGADVVISRTALWTACQVGAGAIVDHCILVHGAAVEPSHVVRDTVCLPARTAAFDIQQSYWGLEREARRAPDLTEMFAEADTVVTAAVEAADKKRDVIGR